jgi:acyl carrier protein
MTQADVLARLQSIFDDMFVDKVVVTPALSAKDVEEWDSLFNVSLIIAVENAFQVRFRAGETEATRNVGELADLILRRLAAR